MHFRDRREAGHRLSRLLDEYRDDRALVLGLPRGGVPVAAEVAAYLDAELDVWVVRRIGVPGHEECGVGAVAEGGAVYIDGEHARQAGADEQAIASALRSRWQEVADLVSLLRGERSAPQVKGRTVIVVDDGLVTGCTLRAVLKDLRAQEPAQLIVAVPVADADVAQEFRLLADEVIVLQETLHLAAVGDCYQDFSPILDEEVLALFDLAHPVEGEGTGVKDMALRVELADATLEGTLTIPPGARVLVLFVHGSGSSRRSPRNGKLAADLNHRGLGTFLFDLLTPDEEGHDVRGIELRFDIGFLASRLAAVTDWIGRRPEARGLSIGYCGASTGAAAALVAASGSSSKVGAIVSRGGRPDLAGDHLGDVRAPVLLVVGGDDEAGLVLNRRALGRLECRKELVVVPGATQLFEEPGALDRVARLAGDWFRTYLVGH